MKSKYTEQSKREKSQSSAQHPSFSSGAAAITNQPQTQQQKTTISAQSTDLPVSSDDTLSKKSKLPSERKMNDYEHIENIKQRISEWRTNFGNENSSFEHRTNYSLEINRSLDDSYVCVLSCRCHQRFKLPVMTTGLFKLSAFYQHLKEQNCAKFSRAVYFLWTKKPPWICVLR